MTARDEHGRHPHQGQPVVWAGTPLEEATVAVILVHGRGASAQGMRALADVLDVAGVAFLAPQAAGHTWYPYSFLEPVERNEPGLSSGLAVLAELVAAADAAGVPAHQVVLLGFSQGACLAAEFAARHARRYGGVFAYSGGLIGAEGTPRDYDGSLEETPVFLGCSDVDPHIPLARVQQSAEVLRGLGADVTERIYPGMGHTINDDELQAARMLLRGLAG